MKPFLILQHRIIDEAADNEFEAFLKYGGLEKPDVRRVRMEKTGIPEINLNDYSAIICGGGPANVSDPEYQKSHEQLRFEADFQQLYPKIIEMDFPYLGACYGIGSLSKFLGGLVSQKNYAEEVGSAIIHLSKEAKSDPLTTGLPNEFLAFVGHKEACQEVAEGTVLLARSEQCPIHMIRFKKNIYATQFHPELDREGISLRIEIYKDHGYFEPDRAASMIEDVKDDVVSVPEVMLKRFIDRYRID